MRSITLLIAISCLLLSCGRSFRGLNDGYRVLNKQEQRQIRQFDPAMGLDDTGDTLKSLYEITASQLQTYMSDPAAMNYVVVWVPFCTGPNCKPLSYYQNLRKKLQAQHINLFIVSDQYDMPEINRQRSQFQYDGKLYVMSHAAYGRQNRGRQVKQFLAELLVRPSVPDSLAYQSFYLFKGKTLQQHGPAAVQHLEQL